MASALYAAIEDEIAALKEKREAVILAHNYQLPEIQAVADGLGDSLGLALQAAKHPARVVVFCGVYFMAETVSLLCPDKTVLVPDIEAGCSLAAMVTPEAVRAWKQAHPDGLVLCYVNSSAAVKAESDYCCTSANAAQVLCAIPADREVLFIPDFFLGKYLQETTGRRLHLWPGYCHAHAKIEPEEIARLKREHPAAEFLMHPECGCLTKSMPLADRILSTEGIVRYAAQSPSEEFIIGTEVGIINRLEHAAPGKRFYPAGPQAVCEYMKRNTLEKVVTSLERLETVVRVPEAIARRARVPIQRMLRLSA